MSDDPISNIYLDMASDTSICETYTVQLHPQHDLVVVGIGASSQVYHVDDQIVLKSSHIFKRPSSEAPRRDQWHYAADTIFHYNLLQNERTVLQLLQESPHRHIIEAIDTNQPEGVYLRKYRTREMNEILTLSDRIRLYCDITDALCHIHSLGIVHADLRFDNILFDDQGCAILSDFSAASPCGQSNFVFPDAPLLINGPSPTLSGASDMFAMASLIFHMEHGVAPQFVNGTLHLPEITSGNQSIDEIIRSAWLGRYNDTSEMLQHLVAIDNQPPQCPETRQLQSEGLLQAQVRRWRMNRI